MAHEDGPGSDVVGGQHLVDVGSEGEHVVGRLVAGLSVTAQVDAHDTVVAGEVIDERVPAVAVLGDAVHEDERCSHPALVERDRHP